MSRLPCAAAALTLLLVCGALAACSGPADTAATTTTTTTTLPVPVTLSGTSPQGSYGSLGPIERVPAALLGPGALSPSATQTLTAYTPGVVRIAFRQFGSGPDLLLVMGEHGTMTWWDPQLLTDLAGHFTVTIFDLPGAGYSAPLPGTPSVESYADATAGLIYSLHLSDTVVLGWGLGGSIAIALAERHPAMAHRLVLIDATAGGPGAVAPSRRVAAAFASPTETFGALSMVMFPPSASAARAAWIDRIDELSPDDIVASGISSEVAAEGELRTDDSISEGLRRLKTPTLVVFGSADRVISPADSLAIAALLSRHQTLELAGAGYAALVQDEQQLLPAIVSFATAG